MITLVSDDDSRSSENDQRLLLLLNNVMYLNDSLFPDLYSKLETAMGNDATIGRVNEQICSTLDKYEESIIDAYIRSKTAYTVAYLGNEYKSLNHTNGSGRTNMSSTAVTSVHPAIMEVVLHLVAVHHELYLYSRNELESTFDQIVDALVQYLDKNADPASLSLSPLQVFIDVTFLKSILHYHLSATSESIGSSMISSLTRQVTQSSDGKAALATASKVLTAAQKNTSLMFASFDRKRR